MVLNDNTAQITGNVPAGIQEKPRTKSENHPIKGHRADEDLIQLDYSLLKWSWMSTKMVGKAPEHIPSDVS